MQNLEIYAESFPIEGRVYLNLCTRFTFNVVGRKLVFSFKETN